MDIERLEIGRFGCLRDVRVDGLGPGVHVFHGTNETGKTTLLEFVRGMLFGFGSLARRCVIDADVDGVGRLVVRPVSALTRISAARRRPEVRRVHPSTRAGPSGTSQIYTRAEVSLPHRDDGASLAGGLDKPGPQRNAERCAMSPAS